MALLLMLPLIFTGFVIAPVSTTAASPVKIVTEEYSTLTEPPFVKMKCRIIFANASNRSLTHIKAQVMFFTPGNVLKAEHITFSGPIYPEEVREWEFVSEFGHYTTDEVEISIHTWSKFDREYV